MIIGIPPFSCYERYGNFVLVYRKQFIQYCGNRIYITIFKTIAQVSEPRSKMHILIFTPLFLPVVKTFGMDPVQFGLILVYNLCIGNITPPVGNTLFVAIKVGRTSLSKVLPYMLGYYVMILLGLLLVTYVPAVSLGLPQMAGLI